MVKKKRRDWAENGWVINEYELNTKVSHPYERNMMRNEKNEWGLNCKINTWRKCEWVKRKGNTALDADLVLKTDK